MENCLEAKTDVGSIVISKDQIWGLSQNLLYFFTDNMNDYAIPDKVSFFNFSETCQEILGNHDMALLFSLHCFTENMNDYTIPDNA